MKLAAFTCWIGDRPLEEALDFLRSLGITSVEIGTGGYPGDAHCRPGELLADPAALARFQAAFASRGMEICAFSCMGNPLHPRPEIAGLHRRQFHDSVLLAARLGVSQVSTFSGCPGTPDDSRYPNWVTATFPSEFTDLLQWQWSERVIPYWREEAAYCAAHGVRVALEPHPGMVVYNTASALRLRHAVDERIGVTYDPSHMWWQQMDPLTVIRALGPAIFHVHAKDTVLQVENTRRNGVIDLAPSEHLADRSWLFRTVGHGHDAQFWKALVAQLRLAGYQGAVSIEAEDPLLSRRESLTSAAALLHGAIAVEPIDAPWWT